MAAFQPPGSGLLKYHQVPAEVVERPEILGDWVEAAVAEAGVSKAGARKPRGRASFIGPTGGTRGLLQDSGGHSPGQYRSDVNQH